jgi:hypothetical protein
VNKVRYTARPWRSRFLRAPALAIRYAERPDFVALRAVADVSLGLKTGADAFFFVELPHAPKADDLGRKGARTTEAVKGFGGWEGELLAGDLRGALLNPHRLQDDRGRAFVVPTRADVAYLAPQDRPPRAGLGDYIAAGERENLHKQKLVISNKIGDRWDRQRRAPIDWRWVLPYNSAYDYGAHDNRAHLVLNGRFVGCRAHTGVDEELVGAALNSTFVIFTRLLEGTATGSEGAYDVGPPAARLMRIPDPRRLDGRASEIKAVLTEWRKANRIPPAPDRTGNVPDDRRRLDELVLLALGATKGDAAYQLDECYSAYARWRAAVEDVEARVRVNRRALAMSGRHRSDRPADLVARQIWDELYADAPILPSGDLKSDTEMEPVSIAANFKAPEHEPMFDAGVVRAPNGQPIDLGSYERVRYAHMLLRLGFRAPLLIPTRPEDAARVANSYSIAYAKLDSEALRLARAYIGPGQAREVADAVLRRWRHACHDAGMRSA